MPSAIIRLITCGSVDDGKSTLIGRLLVETDSVPHDTVESTKRIRRSGSIISAGEIDFSLLTDGLEAEREQGITIDVAYRSMSLLDGRRLIIADAPGHEQYTRNMAVGASRADVAVVLVDATRDLKAQTRRHLAICQLMGVERYAVVINKLDAVDYSREVFEKYKAKLEEILAQLNISNFQIIPISAINGDNVTISSPTTTWYEGPTLFEYIRSWEGPSEHSGLAQLNIQMVLRAHNFRGVAGTIVGGKFAVGDEITVLPRKFPAKIARIISGEDDVEQAPTGSAVTLLLEPDIDASRGDVIQHAANFTHPSKLFRANVVWLGETEMIKSSAYLLIAGSASTPAIVTKIKSKLDLHTGATISSDRITMNEIGIIDLALDEEVVLTSFQDGRDTGNFILVDRTTFETVGAGMVIYPIHRSENITEYDFGYKSADRISKRDHNPAVLWFTGLSGSGKSTIANELETSLSLLGITAVVLDGDSLRHGLNKDLGFSRSDRAENVRRTAEVAKLLCNSGITVIVSLISPFRNDRDSARELIGGEMFNEIWVNTSLEVCMSRDSKHLYAKAGKGEIPNMTGVGQEYEAPLNAELVLDGTIPPIQNVERILEILKK